MALRYKLRTLLILLAVLPPLLWIGWGRYQAWKAEQERQRALRLVEEELILTGNRILTGFQPPQPQGRALPLEAGSSLAAGSERSGAEGS